MAGMHASKIHLMGGFSTSPCMVTEVYPAHLKGSQVTSRGLRRENLKSSKPPQKTTKKWGWPEMDHLHIAMVVFLVGVNDCDGGDRLKYRLKMQDFHKVFEVEVYVL